MILKSNLDSTPSPPTSVQIQIGTWRASSIEVIRQNIAGHCQQTFENKMFVDIT